MINAGWQLAPATTFTKQKLSFTTISVKQAGYIFVWLSYDDDSNNWVYFDDLKVTHTKNNLIQYNEYYPFGMQTATSWTRENNTGNNFLANGGTELNSTSSLYDLEYRNYDPILGRMNQVDPMAAKYGSQTPYNFAFNDPVYWNDPMGADPSPGEPDHVNPNLRYFGRAITGNNDSDYSSHGLFADDSRYGGILFDMTWNGGFGGIGGISSSFETMMDAFHMGDAGYKDKYATNVYRSSDGRSNVAHDAFWQTTEYTLENVHHMRVTYNVNAIFSGVRNSILARTGNQTGNGPSPWRVGWEWLTGTGPRHRDFTGGQFLEMLKKHEHIEETRGLIKEGIAKGQLEGSNPYRLGGVGGIGKYLKDYSTLLTGGTTGKPSSNLSWFLYLELSGHSFIWKCRYRDVYRNQFVDN